MSTRSRIGRLNEDGTITSIYCHFDGYLDGVGRTLLTHYTDPAKIDALIALGDCSALKERVEPIGAHSFDAPEKGTTIAYGRDRGETGVEAEQHPADAWPDSGADYHYVWRDGAWFGRRVREAFALLTPELVAPT